MKINISGRHMDTGNALRTHVEQRITEAVGKYFESSADISVTFSKQGHEFESACALHLDSGLYLQATDHAGDIYHCFDRALAKIEKQLRRYKRRLKNHHDQQKLADVLPDIAPVTAEKVFAPEVQSPDDDELPELPSEFTPVIIAENDRPIPRLSVSDAVMQLELGNNDFVLFRNAAHNQMNLVYRRSDKNIGWLELD